MKKQQSIEIVEMKSNVIRVTFSQEPSREEYNKYLIDLLKLIHLKATISLLFVLPNSYMSSELRIIQGNWIRDNEELLRKKVRHSVFITPSFLATVVLKGIFLINKPVGNYLITGSTIEAEEFLQLHLKESIES